jgi:MFS family permease
MRTWTAANRAVLLLGVSVAFADASIVVLGVPDAMADLHVGITWASWLITAYNVAVVAAGVVLVPLAGRLAPRPLAAAGFAVFALASVGCAAATTIGVLVGFRAVQGAAAALVLVAALPLLGGRSAIRAWTLAATVGLAAGPALGGLLTEVASWRAIFVVQAPVMALGLFAALRLAVHADPDVPGARPRGARLADACLAALSAALVGALFLVVVLLINGFGWEPLPAALVATTLPVLAVAAERIARGLGSPTAVPAGAALVTAGLAILAFLPGAETGFVVTGLALCGAGLGLAAQPLGRLALSGPSVTRDAAWTVAARHAGLVVALVATTPVLVASLNQLEDDAEAVAGEVVLRAPLPIQEKVPVIVELAGLADPQEARLPDVDAALASRAGDPDVDRLADALTAALRDVVAHSFRDAFLVCAGFGLLAFALGLGLGRSRPPVRAPATILVAGAAVVAVVAFAAELGRGALDDPAATADPCDAPADFEGDGFDATIQRVALGALSDAACELDTNRAALLRGLVGDGPSPWSEEELASAVRSGLVDTLDREEKDGTIDGRVAAVIRTLVASAPLDWIKQLLGRL